MIAAMSRVFTLVMLLLVALPAYAEEKSRVEKEADNLGRSLDSAGKRVGRAVERTGDNLWIKKGPKKAPKKKKSD